MPEKVNYKTRVMKTPTEIREWTNDIISKRWELKKDKKMVSPQRVLLALTRIKNPDLKKILSEAKFDD